MKQERVVSNEREAARSHTEDLFPKDFMEQNISSGFSKLSPTPSPTIFWIIIVEQ